MNLVEGQLVGLQQPVYSIVVGEAVLHIEVVDEGGQEENARQDLGCYFVINSKQQHLEQVVNVVKGKEQVQKFCVVAFPLDELFLEDQILLNFEH